MRDPSQLKGWEQYPENLDSESHNVDFVYNSAFFHERLGAESSRLFVQSPDRVVVKVIELGVGVTEKILEDAPALETFLQCLTNEPVTRLFLIPQQSSWGPLVVDESSIRKLLTRFEVFPPFVDILHAFGERTGHEDESYGGLHFRADRTRSVFETAYLVKHVERHGRPDAEEPWSIRQMGIYHKCGGQSGDVFIIVNPSHPLQRRLKSISQFNRTKSSMSIHTAILSCMMENWKWYISDLEKKYVKIKEKAQLTQVDGKGRKNPSTADICIEDTQSIQFLQDKFHQLAHAFEMDRSILREMQSLLAAMPGEDPTQEDDADLVAALISDSHIQMSRVNSMLSRLDGTVALIRTILDFRCLASLQNNSQSMNEMARLAQLENQLIVQLTQKASRDNDILKMLTLLALTYLPASLASSMMGMNYISVQTVKDKLSIHIDGEFVIFIILTVVLLGITFVAYFWYLRNNRRCRTSAECSNDEKGQRSEA